MNAIVTGAASGIGRALVERLAARGDQVLATDVQEIVDLPAGVVPFHLDVRETSDWDAAIGEVLARWERLDLLVNNAGVIEPAWVADLADVDVHRQVDVNLKGVIFGTRAAARAMVAQGGGHIVNVCSLTGLAPTPGMTVYSATKFGIRGFSLGAAAELEEHGVAVTAVLPDGVDTPMGRREVHYDQAALTFSGRRLLRPEEVADALVGCLTRRPLQVLVPRGRGLLSLLAGLWPWLALRVEPGLVRKGRREQDRRRR